MRKEKYKKEKWQIQQLRKVCEGEEGKWGNEREQEKRREAQRG